MKILVTGGCGFIGSNFIRWMLEKYPDYSLVNVDKLTYAGNLKNLSDLSGSPRYTFVRGDITDAGLMEKIVRDGVDAIAHLAAESHVDRSIEDPGQFMKTNVFGTFVLLETVRKLAPARTIRFLHISTDEVYGSLERRGPLRKKRPWPRTAPIRRARPRQTSW